MADQTMNRTSGPDSLEALTADRMNMWKVFTNATAGVVVFMVVLLTLMAIFLL